MSLLDKFLRAYHDRQQRGNTHTTPSTQFVEDVEAVGSSTSKSPHSAEFIYNINDSRRIKGAGVSQDPIFSMIENSLKTTTLTPEGANVEDVACVRENESAIFTLFLKKEPPIVPPPVDSLTRASNILNISQKCDSCPACAHWDGYGRQRPGLYCFFSAVFRGKSARPVPLTEARKSCQRRPDYEAV